MHYDEILADRIKTNGGIHPTLVLNHSNGVSGTTFFDDGSAIYWGEKSMVGMSPILTVDGEEEGGETTSLSLQDLSKPWCGYSYALEFFTDGPTRGTEIRDMTPEEEATWEKIFNGPTDL